jgi:amidohydrolase
MDLNAIKDRLEAEVDARAAVLIEASHQLHARPELAFEEHHAHDLLTDLLEAEGLDVQRGAYGLPTAFAVRAGSSGPCIAVMCEYDALPEIGHACGHNIIATAGLGAGLAAAALAEELGGQVAILGTPAEEGGGGKVLMADRGALEGVDAALMVHPAGADLDAMHVIAIRQFEVTYEGVAAHAAAFPHRGRNALDAAVIGYTNVAALRQHIRPDERIHGIFTEAGDKPNIVPARAAAHWYVRAGTLRRLAQLEERVEACLRAGADAAGCTMTLERVDPVYADLISNEVMVERYRENAARVGRLVLDHREVAAAVVGSTDMGNVSYLVPSIHPMIKVSPPDVVIHSPGFAECAAGPQADDAVIDGAKAMATTIADLWLQPDVLAAATAEFQAAREVRR